MQQCAGTGPIAEVDVAVALIPLLLPLSCCHCRRRRRRRCTRPKLLVMLDVMLGRRKRAVTTPPTFCSMADICPEAMQLVEG